MVYDLYKWPCWPHYVLITIHSNDNNLGKNKWFEYRFRIFLWFLYFPIQNIAIYLLTFILKRGRCGHAQQVEPWLSLMRLPCTEVAKLDLYCRLHVTYISVKVGHSDLVFIGWCGVNKRYLLVKFDAPAMCRSGQTGFVPQTAGDLYFRESRS
jgi:hypothetical protein